MTLDRNRVAGLTAMARFRNRLVHVYWDTDYAQVHGIIRGDLRAFARAVGPLE